MDFTTGGVVRVHDCLRDHRQRAWAGAVGG